MRTMNAFGEPSALEKLGKQDPESNDNSGETNNNDGTPPEALNPFGESSTSEKLDTDSLLLGTRDDLYLLTASQVNHGEGIMLDKSWT